MENYLGCDKCGCKKTHPLGCCASEPGAKVFFREVCFCECHPITQVKAAAEKIEEIVESYYDRENLPQEERDKRWAAFDDQLDRLLKKPN